MAGFGDVRVAERADWFVDQIAVTGSLVLKHVGGGRAGEVAANRLLSSPHCSIEAVIDTFSARTAGACAGREIVCAQDTSEINFKGRAAARKGLGPGGDGVSPGFFIHPLVAIDVKDGALLGIGGAHIWTRPEGKAGSRYKRGPDDKESARWLEGARRAGQVFAGAARVTVVADRESDIFHLFARRPENADLIVRAAQDRALEDRALEDRALEDRALEGGGRLFAALALEDAVETRMVKIAPRGPGDRGRVAKVELRARRVAIKRPRTLRDDDAPKTIAMTLVEAREIDPPPGKTALLWRLLSSADRPAGEIVDLYRLRWRIEEVFRALKSGLGLPDTQMHEASRIMLLAAFALGAAARVIQLVDARDGGARPMDDVIDPAFEPALAAISNKLEGKTARQKNPHARGSLAFVAWVCARLGGWNCYYAPPGPKTMNTGWNVLAQQLMGYAIAMRYEDV